MIFFEIVMPFVDAMVFLTSKKGGLFFEFLTFGTLNSWDVDKRDPFFVATSVVWLFIFSLLARFPSDCFFVHLVYKRHYNFWHVKKIAKLFAEPFCALNFGPFFGPFFDRPSIQRFCALHFSFFWEMSRVKSPFSEKKAPNTHWEFFFW